MPGDEASFEAKAIFMTAAASVLCLTSSSGMKDTSTFEAAGKSHLLHARLSSYLQAGRQSTVDLNGQGQSEVQDRQTDSLLMALSLLLSILLLTWATANSPF